MIMDDPIQMRTEVGDKEIKEQFLRDLKHELTGKHLRLQRKFQAKK